MRKLAIIILSVLIVSVFFTVNLSAKQRGIRITAKSGKSFYLYKDYHALVVGVGDYTQGWPDLPGAIKDAREVASSLKELGFTVKLVLDPTSSQLKSALNNMAFRLGREKNRALLLYYAGHGETLELADGTELGYIIPTDSPLKSRDPMGFDDKAVSMRDIEDLALKVKSKHFLMLFDSCFSGSLFGLVRAAPVDITEKSVRPVRQFITAGEAGEQVPDKSVFKIVFLDGIRGDADLNDDGYVTGSELGMHLQDKVVNYTRGGQHPQYGKINNPKLDKGDFIFRLGKVQPEPPSSLEAERQRIAEERARLEAESKRLADEQRRLEEERKLAEERQRLASEQAKLEAERKRLEAEKEKLKIAKLPPKPKYSPPSYKSNEVALEGTFIAYASGVVRDTKTGLEWVAGPDRATTWHEAKSWVESLNINGGGWRMPTVKELRTLYKKGAGKRSMTPLLKTKGWWVWSGETKGSSSAWLFNFLHGYEAWRYRSHSDGYYRAFAVRSRSDG